MDIAAIEEGIDPRKVLSALGYSHTSEPKRIRGGWDTLLWRFQTPAGEDCSLRVYFLPNREEVAERERIALLACEKAGFPAPRILRIDSFDGLPVMVLSWCDGLPILSYVEKRPWTLWRLSRLFGQAQARLHSVAPPAEFAAGAPDLFSRLPPEYSTLAEHAASLGLTSGSLIHMDYHPLNVISDGDCVTGVVDWGGAAAGDPRADLARTHITIATAPVPPGPLKPALSLLRGLMLRGWRSGYQALAGPMPDYRPLRGWAAATLLAEIVKVIDRSDVWASEEYVDDLRRAIGSWARESGITLR